MSDPIALKGPVSRIDATVEVPGSKSQANRALVCAFLAEGSSRISNVPNGDDTAALIEAMRVAGAATMRDGTVDVTGGSADRLPSSVWCNLAGTTSRFLTAVGSLSSHDVTVDGGDALRGRPMHDLHDALRSLGARVKTLGSPGHLPVRVGGTSPTGRQVALKGDVSSQFITSLMLIGPCLPDGLEIRVEGPLVSAPYIEMTAEVMRWFGAEVDVSLEQITVRPGRYVGRSCSVEPDFSSAAFPIVATVIGGGRVRVPGLASSRLQGDSRVLEIVSRMGAIVTTEGSDVVVVREPSRTVQPIFEDMGDCSDLVPVVAAACLVATGESVISGVGFIRGKESNRLEDLAAELRLLGADVHATADGLRVVGGRPLRHASLATHHDHRLGMAFATLSSVAPGLVIKDPHVVSKSWPGYFEVMAPVIGPAEDRPLRFSR